MKDALDQVVYYLDALGRRRWQVCGVAWMVAALIWAGTTYLPDQYTSSARIYYENRSAPRLKPMGYIDVPTGAAVFPAEIYLTPRAWAEAELGGRLGFRLQTAALLFSGIWLSLIGLAAVELIPHARTPVGGYTIKWW